MATKKSAGSKNDPRPELKSKQDVPVQSDIEDSVAAVEKAFDEPFSEAPATPARRMKGATEVFHDLFKLQPASFKKILGVADARLLRTNPNGVRMADVEHCHFFHSVDSNGRPQKYSSSIGSHCHEIKIELNDDGSFVAECGPPLRKFGNSRVEMGESYDKHTHEIVYVESEQFKARVANQDAVIYKSKFTTPAAPSTM